MDKIILVEDEQAIADAIVFNLELEDYTIEHYDNGRMAVENIDRLANADLVILDVMLPEVNGIEICKKIRLQSQVPVLFLSAKGTSTDKIEGLKSGGTDYLSKPFDLEEMLLRVKILIGRNAKKSSPSITIGDKIINFETYIVSDQQGNHVTELSKREVALLQLFASKKGLVVSRDEILDNVWGTDQYPTARTIDNFILTFRKIFEDNPKEPKYFHSIRGVGYKFTA